MNTGPLRADRRLNETMLLEGGEGVDVLVHEERDQLGDALAPRANGNQIGFFLEGRQRVGDCDREARRLHERVVVLRIADRDDVMKGYREVVEGGFEAARFVDPGWQDHHRRPC